MVNEAEDLPQAGASHPLQPSVQDGSVGETRGYVASLLTLPVKRLGPRRRLGCKHLRVVSRGFDKKLVYSPSFLSPFRGGEGIGIPG